MSPRSARSIVACLLAFAAASASSALAAPRGRSAPAARAPAKPATPAKPVVPAVKTEPSAIAIPSLASLTLDDQAFGQVMVEILEGGANQPSWTFKTPLVATERYTENAFAFVGTPKKYSAKGIVVDRSNPFVLRATSRITLPAGEYRLLLRARGATRVFLDGKLQTETPFVKSFADGHEPVPDLPLIQEPGLRPLPVGHTERLLNLKLDGLPHEFRLENFVGGDRLRLETGELALAIAPVAPTANDDRAVLWGTFRLLAPQPTVELSDEGWSRFAEARRARLTRLDTLARHTRGAGELAHWQARHDLAQATLAERPPVRIPHISGKLPVHNEIDRFLGERLDEAGVTPAPLADDATFLRRVTLDTLGVIPTRAEVERSAATPDLSDAARAKQRLLTIDQLLADPRWADHWMGYWQDVLAENPGILKPVLNNTGPFRWWLHEALRDNKPADRFATELILMEGSQYGGGPAAFGVASENDAPLAAKAQTLAKAFLGLEMQCARCHDAPYQPFKQVELFSLAAMLGNAPQKVPASSVLKEVQADSEGRTPRVTFTLKPGEAVPAAWSLASIAPAQIPAGLLRDAEAKSTRAQFAALVTSPANDRFAQVLVNRLWKRYLGWGLVEPVDDWTDNEPSHPELLDWLARELVTHDYDLKHVARLILTSHAYQRQVLPERGMSTPGPRERLFASPGRRRMTAEQLVDSLYAVAGKRFGAEELNFDIDGRRQIESFLNLGRPERAWELTSLSNERDRPALSLPVAQSILDLLVMYGWRESRPNPITVREEFATPLQPLVLANGVVGSRIVRLSDDSALTAICLEDLPLKELIDAITRQILSRPASAAEYATYAGMLEPGYATRRIPLQSGLAAPSHGSARTMVSWSNHLSPEASRIKLELEREARAGDPPSAQLNSDWRERMEDVIWAMLNSPEFVFVP